NRPTSPTALTLCFTLPPPSRLRQRCSIAGVSGLARLGASESRPVRRLRTPPTPRTMRGGPKWRNWQTRRTQNPVPFGECGFDSHLRHRTVERDSQYAESLDDVEGNAEGNWPSGDSTAVPKDVPAAASRDDARR